MKDDIIRMAREAGLCDEEGRDDSSVIIENHLKRFDALVRADEREVIAKMVEGLFDDPNDSVLAFIVDAIRARGNT
jgi:hypothetical protein